MEIKGKRVLLEGKCVKFFTRSFSPELYKFSSCLYNNREFECVRLTDQSADAYFYKILSDKECDIAINVDEDAFITNIEIVLDLAGYVVANNISNAGCPDCGPACPRGSNPIITNPFFNILNLELIRELFSDIKEIKNFNYEKEKNSMRERFLAEWDTGQRGKLEGDFDSIDMEPYYPFFFFLAFNSKVLYLPAFRHNDKWSTILCDINNNQFCLHSWFARKYKIQKYHTQRIENLINQAYDSVGAQKPVITPSDRRRFMAELTIRHINKLVIRIKGWPRKWVKWYKRWKRERKAATLS